jgi:hypothetical protein
MIKKTLRVINNGIKIIIKKLFNRYLKININTNIPNAPPRAPVRNSLKSDILPEQSCVSLAFFWNFRSNIP